MKNLMLTIFIFFAAITVSYKAESASTLRNSFSPIIMSGYNNYAPWGYLDKKGNYQTIFQPILDNIRREFKNVADDRTYDTKDVENIVRDIRTGEVDLFIGGYNQTKEFENLHLLFPAVVQNPITFFVLPSKISSIKSIEDISQLKGARFSNEIFSDFIENKLLEFNLEKVDSGYEMFEKLFTKKIDYIISSYYFCMIEAIKLGVSRQISSSKQALWNIPVFVGISQISPHRDKLARHISRFFQDDNFISTIKENLRKAMEQFETEYAGVVPPAFEQETPPKEPTTSKAVDAKNNTKMSN